MKKVFVSGCYDIVHAGHIQFFEEGTTESPCRLGIGKINFCKNGQEAIASW